jgi:hypothetical protein
VADGDLVLPFRVEQIGPVLRCVRFLHVRGVVVDEDGAGRGGVESAVGIDVAEALDQVLGVHRLVFLKLALLLQQEEMADIG